MMTRGPLPLFSGLLLSAGLALLLAPGLRSAERTPEKTVLRNPPSAATLSMAEEAMGGEKGPFYPSPVRTADGKRIPAHLMMSPESCGNAGCHPDIVREWTSSAHAFSGLANPWYRKTIESLHETAGAVPAKYCAGCHSPVLLQSGGADRPLAEVAATPVAQAGVTCATCHMISNIGNTLGNGNYELAVPAEHERLLKDPKGEAGRIRKDPAAHRNAYLKPFYEGALSAAYCGSCHKSFIDEPVNNWRWLREDTDYDNWQASSISGMGGRSFYKPAKTQTCSECHMPLVRSNDAGNDKGWVRSHRFAAANSAIPAWRGDKEQLEAVRRFLQDRLTVDVFALSEARAANAEKGAAEDQVASETFLAPLDRIPATVRRGESRRLDVVVRSHDVGHLFPGGKTESFDCWLEFKAVDDRGRVIFWSGKADEASPVAPGTHSWRTHPVDEKGNQIDRRNTWQTRGVAWGRRIIANTADVVRFRLEIPPDAGDRITLTARLQYRKFNPSYTAWAFAGKTPPRLPILTVAEDTATLAVVDAGAPLPDMTRPKLDAKADWLRFNDYGIGLLIQRDSRAAERAFHRVTEIVPGQVDGWLNLAQLAQVESDLEAYRKNVDKAVQIAPDSPRTLFQLAQLEEALGNHAKALEYLRRVAAQYPDDRIILFEIASILQLQENWTAVVETLNQVLELDPQDRGSHLNLGLAYRALGNAEKSAYHQKLAQRFAPVGASPILDGKYWADHPHENNERLPIHEHRSIPLETRK